MPSKTITTNNHESAWSRLEIRGRSPGIDITAAEREAEFVRRRRARRVAYIGVAAAVAHVALKVAWALGSTIGVEDEPMWEQSTTTELEIALWGTAALAAIAAAILLALVQPWGRVVPRRVLRPLAWLGSVVMTVAGAVGLTMSIGYLVGAWDMDRGDLYTITYVYVYGGFLLLGLAFGTTAWLTRASGRGSSA